MIDEEELVKKSSQPKIQFLIVEMSRNQATLYWIFIILYKLTYYNGVSKLVYDPYFAFGAAVTDIDTSGIHALEELYRSLQKREIQVNSVHQYCHLASML